VPKEFYPEFIKVFACYFMIIKIIILLFSIIYDITKTVAIKKGRFAAGGVE